MITMAKAKKLGWNIERGAYIGTTDDRLDRWYVYRWDAYRAIDRRGPGFPSKRAALAALERYINGSE